MSGPLFTLLQMIRQFNLDLKFRENPYAGDKNDYYIKIVIGTCPGALKR